MRSHIVSMYLFIDLEISIIEIIQGSMAMTTTSYDLPLSAMDQLSIIDIEKLNKRHSSQ